MEVFWDFLQVGIIGNDDGGIPTELECHSFLSRPRIELPAHFGRAGEREELHPLVLDER